MSESTMRTLQDLISQAREVKNFGLAEILELTLEQMYEADLIFKCPSCDKYTAEQVVECHICIRHGENLVSQEMDYQSRNFN